MPTSKKPTPKPRHRAINPSAVRADGNLIIGSVQTDGLTRLDVTTRASNIPGWGREVCLETVTEAATHDGRLTGKIVTTAAPMSMARARALLVLLLNAIEEG